MIYFFKFCKGTKNPIHNDMNGMILRDFRKSFNMREDCYAFTITIFRPSII